MKYMGSKRWMLSNGLGHLLDEAVPKCNRFIDLFAGSSAVARFVATRHKVAVHAVDLQHFSRIISAAVIERTEPLLKDPAWSEWLRRAEERRRDIRDIPEAVAITQASVREAREWCALRRAWPVTRAYGGHYFSPGQAIWIDALRASLPKRPLTRKVALASLIGAAAYCAASPGHTAQPFQPTKTAKEWLRVAWARDVVTRTEATFGEICALHALEKGSAYVGNATEAVKDLLANDLVFIDPPYSGVQYSRFYHVLESIATAYDSKVEGIGRYPPASFRPTSDFSLTSRSVAAMDLLLQTIASRNARAIVTFPDQQCSNGLSGRVVASTAAKYFKVQQKIIKSKLSSLGGRSGTTDAVSDRAARQSARELVLYLLPKRRSRTKQSDGRKRT